MTPTLRIGLLIFARVRKSDADGVQISGGRGVGIATKKGLWQPVGEAAINRVPREMITRAVEEVCEELEQPCRDSGGNFGSRRGGDRAAHL